MAINYEDERLTAVEQAEQDALTEHEQMTKDMTSEVDTQYKALADAAHNYGEQQKEIQQANTDFALKQIEQQKEQAHKDYLKEQAGAYKDWQKESNRYGAGAEEMAASGLRRTGYSESSQVSLYNTYQNRVATAKDGYNRAVLNYDNAMKDAHLQNNAKLAEIAFNALQTELTLALEGMQYRNQLLLDQANRKMQIQQMYHGQYQDVLGQLNTEAALEEQIRQYNESLREEQRQYDLSLKAQKEANDASIKAQQEYNAILKNQGGSSNIAPITTPNLDNSSSEKDGYFKANAAKYGTLKGNPDRPGGIIGYGYVMDLNSTVQVGENTYDLYETPNDGSIWYWNGSRYVVCSKSSRNVQR